MTTSSGQGRRERLIKTLIHLFETTQVIASVFDVALDVAVCYDFYVKGYSYPFYASVSIFIAAQIAYAFLFAATYGRRLHTVKGKLYAFVLALPVAQLVPLFSWLESQRWLGTNNILERLGLAPTEVTFTADGDSVGGNNPNDIKSNDEDHALWSFFLSKFRSNIGFLVEAIVEAIPQAMIQTYVVVVYGDIDWLIIVSILFSVFVVASKGYMLSYSIHGPTFIFNSFCVVADVCGLFASIVWAFGTCSADSFTSTEPNLFYLCWVYLGALTSILISCWGLAASMFANFDDHLKFLLTKEGRWRSTLILPTKNVLFDIWTVRTAIWFVAVVPVSVLLLALKASALPLFFLDSLRPAHFVYPAIHRRVFAYLDRGGSQEVSKRLKELNMLLKQAVVEANFNPGRANFCYYQAATRATAYDKKELRAYVSGLGRLPLNVKFAPKMTVSTTSVNSSADDDVSRAAIRADNARRVRDRELTDFERRSVVYWFLRGAIVDEQFSASEYNAYTELVTSIAEATTKESTDAFPKSKSTRLVRSFLQYLRTFFRGEGPRWFQWRRDSLKIKILRIFGFLCFGVSVLLLIAIVPVLACLSLCGVILPFLGTYRILTSGTVEDLSLEATLGLILSFFYFASLIMLLVLFPAVFVFQSTHKDLYDFSDHSVLGQDAFYVVGLDAILEEAYIRYREVLGKEKLNDFLETKANVHGAKHIQKFLSGSERL